MHIKPFAITLMLTSLTYSLPAYAEVMDKEPSLSAVWAWVVVSGVIGFLLTRWRIWLMILSLPIPLVFFWELLLEIRNPFAGAAIRAEAGMPYILSAYLAPALILAAHLAAAWVYIQRRKVIDPA